MSMPRPSSVGPSSSPQPKKASSSTRASWSNLLSVESNSPPSFHRSTKKSSPQPLVDLLTGPTASPTPAASDKTKTSSSSTVTKQNLDLITGPLGPASSTEASGQKDGGQKDLMFDSAAESQQLSQKSKQTTSMNAKDSIMSLFDSQQQPQLSSYTAQGYPVNPYYYQQQQAASMHMAQVSAMQQQQVNQVTAQMQKIKMTQGGGGGRGGVGQPVAPTMSNGVTPRPPHTASVGVGMMSGGQTLNPTLW